MWQRGRLGLAVILSFAFLFPAHHLDATTVRWLALEKIIRTADRIFVGRCIDVRSLRDGYGLPATFITFSVQETIKGNMGRVLTIKMIGSGEAFGLRFAESPTFQEGEEVLLAVYPDSKYGFTSPVGLQQGKWTVVKSESGKKMLRRSLGGAAIIGGPPTATYARYGEDSTGLVDYNRFIGLVKRMAREEPGAGRK